jgi:hypothetical protein
MHIILGKENAEFLRQRHVVLELETFCLPNKDPVTAYCVVPAETIFGEMQDMERLQGLHQAVVDAWNRKDYSTVAFGIEHLRGKFGGELDSFYHILLQAIKEKHQVE